MKAELMRKTTRTVHGDKVIRLRLDIPYNELELEGTEEQDIGEWLDVRVGELINMEFSDFVDESQQRISEAPQDE